MLGLFGLGARGGGDAGLLPPPGFGGGTEGLTPFVIGALLGTLPSFSGPFDAIGHSLRILTNSLFVIPRPH